MNHDSKLFSYRGRSLSICMLQLSNVHITKFRYIQALWSTASS